ncbi:uncharacterized protein Y057_3342 [Fusarium fujikuroi]|nr:uncharacterized protein Y057_3342 [Fusarium fujikuroi]
MSAELALAIIPLGIKVCSGLSSYFGSLNDYRQDVSRLARQTQAMENVFRDLEVLLEQSQLDPQILASAVGARSLLEACKSGLQELQELEQKLSIPIKPSAKALGKTKARFAKFSYPLRKSHIMKLQTALDTICVPLQLAIEKLHIDIGLSTRNSSLEVLTALQQTSGLMSSLTATTHSLASPLGEVSAALPILQSSVDAINPYITGAIQSYMEQTQLAIRQADAAARERAEATNKLIMDLQIREPGPESTILCLRAKSSPPTSLSNSGAFCSCRGQRLRTYRGGSYGPLYVFHESITVVKHENNCQLYAPVSEFERSQGLRVAFSNVLIKGALQLCFYTKKGAGGFSISPGLAFSPIVDRHHARAWDLLSYGSYCVVCAFNQLRPAATTEAMFRVILSKLRLFFSSRMASPMEVDIENNSLLHELAKLINLWFASMQMTNRFRTQTNMLARCLPVMEELVNFIASAGSPLSTRNRQGHLALHLAAYGVILPASLQTAFHADGANLELNANIDQPYNRAMNWRRSLLPEILKNSALQQGNAELFHGPLITAILKNDLGEVKRLIKESPAIVQERNVYGQTAFHVAADKLKIFRILIQQAKPTTWTQRDELGHTLLGFSMVLSSVRCNYEISPQATNCSCTSTVRALLESGCPIVPHHDFWTREGSVLRNTSTHCRVLVAEQLRLRRRELRRLACDTLSMSAFSQFQSSQRTELDLHAIEVDRTLRRRRVITFGRLSTFFPGDIDDTLKFNYVFRPIYHDLVEGFDAKVYLDLGFREFDLDTTQFPTSRVLPLGIQISRRADFLINPDYLLWLRDHAVPMTKRENRIHESKDSTFIFADRMGCWSMFDDLFFAEETKELEHWFSSTRSVMECHCPCSPGFCTPFIQRMKWLPYKYEERTSPEHRTLSGYANDILSFMSKYGQSLTTDQHVAAVRQVTFSVLEMKHICSHRPSDDYVEELSPDEIQFELDTQDSYRANALNEVTSEATSFFSADHHQVSPKEHIGAKTEVKAIREGNGAYHNDPDLQQEIEYDVIVEYWHKRWIPMVEKILDDARRLFYFDHDEEGLRDIGVVLENVTGTILPTDDDGGDVGEYELKWEGSGNESREERESRIVSNWMIRQLNSIVD